MKKSFIRTVCVFSLAAFAISGAFAKNVSGKNKSKKAANHAEYIDWQGQAANKDIPQWYGDILSQESESVIRSSLNLPDDVRIFTVIAYGSNRKALMTITDSFGIQSSVAAAFRQNVMRCADQVTKASGLGEEEVSSSTAQITEMVTVNLDLIGLERAASYWTQYRVVDKKGKEVTPAKYAYVVVMKMSRENYEKQMEASIRSVESATDQAEDVRKLASLTIARLRNPDMVSGSVNCNVDIGDKAKAEGDISAFSTPFVAAYEPEVDFSVE
ncbi:MAG: hypothetical protein MJZ50_00805 [Treponema sp.]|nr:hypothetical protein [Treponema sp.]